MFGFLKSLFPSKKDKDVAALRPLAAAINVEFARLSGISDDQLRQKSTGLRERIRAHVADITAQITAKTDEATLSPIAEQEALFEERDRLVKVRDEQLEDILDQLLPEAFAVVKETALRLSINHELRVTATDWDRAMAESKQALKSGHIVIEGDTAIWKNRWIAAGNEVVWNMVHYDVQLMGGVVLHQGKIAEMATGEGKTLVGTLPVFLNALTGEGVHLITVNPYLAQRDAEWNAPLYQFHGMSVDCIDLHEPNSDDRRNAYLADITYGTNNEFGFDYLRDNMTTHPEYLVQRRHFYAIVDEVDSVLVDEARTPLIISGPVPRGDKHEFDILKPGVERVLRAQRDLVNKYIADVRKNWDDEKNTWKTDDKQLKESLGLSLFRSYRALPKHPALIKLLSEQGVRSEMFRVEGMYMQDNNRRMPEADTALYFTIDEKNNHVELTDLGREMLAGKEDPNLFVLPDVAARFSAIEISSLSNEERLKAKDQLAAEFAEKSERVHSINQLLKAYTLFEKDVDYILQEDKVMIVDEQTGRVLPGRRYSDGLHQAIEAKENVKIENATQTFATVTLQNYFRMYHKLAGMTGTAETEEKEFYDIYKLDVVVIPTHRAISRKDLDDLVYRTKKEKYNAVVDEIRVRNEKGQPVLVGTTSVEDSEKLSKFLQMAKIEHNVLNAKNHAREAEIVAGAGQRGAVTIATNMAGRGTDIKLGEGVVEAGGLAIIGTERHESRRIDRQLRGRSGRQGDPGESQFFVSLEDDLMRLFRPERITKYMDRFGFKEGEVIQAPMVTNSISTAQKKVEESNYGMRKRLLEYDDVMNAQREVVYRRRKNALYGDRIKLDIDEMLHDQARAITERYFDIPDAEGLNLEAIRLLAVNPDITERELNDHSREDVAHHVYEVAREFYERKTNSIAANLTEGIAAIKQQQPHVERIVIPFTDGSYRLQIVIPVKEALESKGMAILKELEKSITLSIIDDKWKTHLREMDELRQTVQNAVFEQKDPLLIYKFESFELYQQMLREVNQETLSLLWKSNIAVDEQEQQKQQQAAQQKPRRDDFSRMRASHPGSEAEQEEKRSRDSERRVMAGPSGGPDRPLSRSERRAQERDDKRKR